ncbi:Tyrosine-protein kinase receptor [Balamuthia mandrillaris]
MRKAGLGVIAVVAWALLCISPVNAEDLLFEPLIVEQSEYPAVAVYKDETDEMWSISQNQATTLVVYSFATKTFRTVSTTGSIPAVTSRSAGGIIGNKIYHVGGYGSSETHVLDTETLVWSKLANMPIYSIYGHVVITVKEENRLFVYGGFGSGYYKTVYEYFPANNSWVTKGSEGSGVAFTYGVAMGQYLFLHAGEAGAPNTNQYLRFEMGTNSWTTLAPRTSLVARRFHGMIADESSLSIWIVGGLISGGTAVHYRTRFNSISTQQPYVDSFSGSALCYEYLIVHDPSGNVLCKTDSAFYKIKRGCNYISGCPLVETASCPPTYPIRCASKLCAAVPAECSGLRTTCSADQITCFNGACATSCEACSLPGFSCPSGEIKCCDGSCRSSYDLCPTTICTPDKPFRCSDGLCKATAAECNTLVSCAFGEVACGDGRCALESECKRAFCPISSFFCPSDLSCASQEEGCGAVQSYCGEGKVVCWDGSCVSSTALCARPLLLEKIAPISLLFDTTLAELQLPIASWMTGTVLGSITVDVSVLEQNAEIILKEANPEKMKQANFSASAKEGSEIMGPCMELSVELTSQPTTSFVKINMIVNLTPNLRAKQFSVVHLNNETMEWTFLPTTAGAAAGTTQAEASASFDGDGTFCLAYSGDKRPFLTLVAPAVFVIRGSSDLQIAFSLSSPVWDDVTLPFTTVGTAEEGTDYTLFSESKSPAVFSAGSSSVKLILFFPEASFTGYRTLQFQFSEATPAQIEVPDVEIATILLTNTFLTLSSEDILAIFPAISLLHQLIPFKDEIELIENQLEVTIEGIVEMDRNGTELVYHPFPLAQEFTTTLLGENALKLSGLVPLLNQSVSLEATFRLNSTQVLDLSPSEETRDEMTTIESLALFLDLTMGSWELHPSTAYLELSVKLASSDGMLTPVTTSPDEGNHNDTTSERRTARTLSNQNDSVVTAFRSEHTWIWLESSLVGEMGGNDVPRVVLTDDGKPMIHFTLPSSGDGVQFHSLMVLRRNTEVVEEDKEDEDTNLLVIILPAAGGGLLLLICLAVILLVVVLRLGKRHHKTKKDLESAVEMAEPSEYLSNFNSKSGTQKKNKGVSRSNTNGSALSSLSVGEMFALDYNELEFGKQIGQGSFGVVYQGEWRLTPVAIKLLNNLKQEQLEEFQQEVELMQNLRPHSNVVLLLGVCVHPEHPLCIVTELLPKGSLLDFLKSQEAANLNHKDLLRIAKGIAAGMQHLHAEQIVHCDLSARNILLTETLEAKVADFGMSRVLSADEEQHKTLSNVGPVRWMAPESIKDRVYSEKTDVWSFGVVLWEIASFGEMPYKQLTPMQVSVQVVTEDLRLEPPEGAPEVFGELMMECFAKRPEDRPSFKSLHSRLHTTFKQN